MMHEVASDNGFFYGQRCFYFINLITFSMNIFITGASSGIGRALALAYAKRYQSSDLTIGLVARRHAPLQQLEERLVNDFGVRCKCYALDVRDADALHDAAHDFIASVGVPHIVIASAGVSSGTMTEEMADSKIFQAIFDINVMGTMHTFQPFIQAMKASAKAGELAHCVGIASVAGIRGLPGSGAYCASKAAVISYCESLRIEMQAHHIQVSTILPGYIRTPMTAINQYSMPFLMDVDRFALLCVNTIDKQVRYRVIPWQMGIIAKIMRLIPDWAWDKLLKNAPHKKRIAIDDKA